MNSLRNLFSLRTLNSVRQHGQNVLYNIAQPVDGAVTAAPAPECSINDQRTCEPLKIPKSILDATTFTGKKFGESTLSSSGSISPTTLKRLRCMERKVELVYRCKLCNTRNSKLVSQAAYRSGVVILQCDGCSVNHLIADHSGWFAKTKGKNFDQVLAERCDRIKIIKVNEKGELI
ncbi:PREDICTED: DNL-type zinc finger protein [Rhagoletis zephyria]|uniref:DNL-type zinc finger protein n=1 Tax=Rhagoletis zephyria TaxID=28612 RepID=UPI000811A31A|nr:PREDICTED: DNL-type zinc finger protein [Rhagoletis zephyria]XP_036342987.1 DNL-type zinc finger protein-like [Rhagoletis pomonella]XP_036343001.1 DNL-type zinc finger protein-like [Rhagoletis pomonella]XP_036343061.1 DNL-type zinc finger protein-like [Rhagoletis pomonella]XP_036343079.1 DNL-type zinc finger protein-like [Rhagoletis pomonella]XP_036346984.1 DNL-type zinc finger protein-like [Rhagoletis pomonella]